MSAINTFEVDMTILATATTSEKLSSLLSAGQLKNMLGSLLSLTIWAPAALTGTVSLTVSPAEAGTMSILSLNGSDVTIPAARATTISAGGFKDLQLLSGSAEASDRVFKVIGQLDIR